ncbi:MAG TPA: histidine phosphatase family protein [Ilumatobacteraceae bacterium]|nr:histidine phosphatase family protein [Ilumatobacteraceae bacterium]
MSGVHRVYLVRHGRAAAGWDTDPDPDLDDVGRAQAATAADRLEPLAAPEPLAVLTSPMQRCRQTAAALCERWAVSPDVDTSIGEIPSPYGVAMPERVDWLRAVMVGTWSALGEPYTTFRDGVVARVRAVERDTVMFSHFVAINAVIGACDGDDRLVIRRLDNCSITVVDVEAAGGLVLTEGGHEADTLIR